MQLEPGHQIERYVVEGILGQGGAASVYRVRHVTLGSTFALKVLAVPSKSIRGRMLQEGRIQATIRSSNVVQIVDVFDVDGHLGLLMEYVKGPSLAELLTAHRFPLDEALAVFGGILAGVDVAHEKGLIHRDVKPANVLIQLADDGIWPKVTDFGIAKGGESADPVDVTRPGSTMGTPCYMPPEQIHDASSVDKRADIWSLGCVLYELVCHQRAFPGDYLLDILNAVVRGEFIPPEQHVPNLPPRVLQAIRGALVLDPASRIPDCRTLAAVLAGKPSAESVGEALERHLPRSSPSIAMVRSLAFRTPPPVAPRSVTPAGAVTPPAPPSRSWHEVVATTSPTPLPRPSSRAVAWGRPIAPSEDTFDDERRLSTEEVQIYRRAMGQLGPVERGTTHDYRRVVPPTFWGLPLEVAFAASLVLAVGLGLGLRYSRVASSLSPSHGVSVATALDGQDTAEAAREQRRGNPAAASSGQAGSGAPPVKAVVSAPHTSAQAPTPETPATPQGLGADLPIVSEDLPRRSWSRLKLTGDARRAVLRAGGREYLLPGKVPPGTFAVEAWFSESRSTPAGQVVVPQEAILRLDCSVIWQRCELKE